MSRDRDEDDWRDTVDERRERARLNHWCDLCHGHTGPNSPCYSGPDEPEPEPAEPEEDEEP